jgi:hypothetical protein
MVDLVAQVMTCPHCGEGLRNSDVSRAHDKLLAAILEYQRQIGGHYKRRPNKNTKANGFTAMHYKPTYKQYPALDVEAAWLLSETIGIRKAAKQTGIPKSTLSDYGRRKSDGGQSDSDRESGLKA